MESIEKVLGTPIVEGVLSVGSLLMTTIVLVGFLILIRYLPLVTRRALRRLFPHWVDKEGHAGPAAAVQVVRAATILLALVAMGATLHWKINTRISAGGAVFTLGSVLTFAFALFVFYAFAAFVVSRLLSWTIPLFLGDGGEPRMIEEYRAAVLGPVKWLVILIGTWVSYTLAFSPPRFYEGFVVRALEVALILAVTVFLARLVLIGLRRRFSVTSRSESAGIAAMGKFVKAGIYLVGFVIALNMAGVDVFAVATAAGLVGFAIAFGLQDTISNIASGISLASEKPFEIGDRIKVGPTMGDVVEITLRSTRIRTIENQTVSIPNSLMGRQEVWNLTRDSPVVVLTIPVGISYDSDWRLAEHILTTVAEAHPKVLHAPSPRVYITEFGSSSINLSLWVWIMAQDMYEVRSDLLKAIKDRFDIEGVEIPYQYVTLVNKADLAKPTKVPRETYSEQGPVYPWESAPKLHKEIAPREHRKILVPTAGPMAVREKAAYVFALAKESNRDIQLLYIVPFHDRQARKHDWGEVLRVYTKMGSEMGVKVEAIQRRGNVVEEILTAAREEGVDLVVMGASSRGVMRLWTEGDVVTEVSRRSPVPVIVIPSSVLAKGREPVGVPTRRS